jgi:membrane protein
MERRPPSNPKVYWRALRASIADVPENNLGLISAGVAFFAMLSLFPALAALIAILGLISDPAVVVSQLEGVRGLIPGDVYDILHKQVVGLVTSRADTLGWAGVVSVVVAIWSARAGVGAMVIGLNNVYNERNRKAAHHYFRALLMTVGLVCVAIVALLTVVVAPVILAFFPLGPFGTLMADVVRWSVAISVLLAGVGVLYRFGPNRRAARVGWLTVGAVMAVASWAIVSIAFSYYVANFGNYNQVYGSIGAVIAMLVWLWISSFLILLGASLNAQIELRTHPDSTIGRSKPLGQRGAFMADHLVEVDEEG